MFVAIWCHRRRCCCRRHHHRHHRRRRPRSPCHRRPCCLHRRPAVITTVVYPRRRRRTIISHQACPEPLAQCVEHAEPHVNQRENLFSPPPHSAEHEQLCTQLPAQGKRMLHCTWMWLGGRRWRRWRAKAAAKAGYSLPRWRVTADGLFSDGDGHFHGGQLPIHIMVSFLICSFFPLT